MLHMKSLVTFVKTLLDALINKKKWSRTARSVIPISGTYQARTTSHEPPCLCFIAREDKKEEGIKYCQYDRWKNHRVQYLPLLFIVEIFFFIDESQFSKTW